MRIKSNKRSGICNKNRKRNQGIMINKWLMSNNLNITKSKMGLQDRELMKIIKCNRINIIIQIRDTISQLIQWIKDRLIIIRRMIHHELTKICLNINIKISSIQMTLK